VQTFSSPYALEASSAPIVLMQNLFSSSVLHSSPATIGPNIATIDVSNLQTSPASVVAVHIAFMDAIVSLFNNHQVISLKLTNKNYIY